MRIWPGRASVDAARWELGEEEIEDREDKEEEEHHSHFFCLSCEAGLPNGSVKQL
jgi:hypothetical protein